MNLSWIPNAITLVRIAAAPAVVFLIWAAGAWSDAYYTASDFFLVAFALFSVACLTDWLDGWLARALNATSSFGAKLDLWADKIIVAGVLVGFLIGVGELRVAAIFGLIALTARDLYIMRLRAAHPEVNLAATFAAKCKTAVVMTGLALVLLGFGVSGFTLSVFFAGAALYVIGCLLSLYTGWQYVAAVRQQQALSS